MVALGIWAAHRHANIHLEIRTFLCLRENRIVIQRCDRCTTKWILSGALQVESLADYNRDADANGSDIPEEEEEGDDEEEDEDEVLDDDEEDNDGHGEANGDAKEGEDE